MAFIDIEITNIHQLVSAVDRVAEAITSHRSAGLHFSRVRAWGGELIEGDIRKVNLKNDQQIHVTASFTNLQGGPASIQTGSAVWEGTNNDAFTVESPDPATPDNELSALVRGNPQSVGDDTAVGIVKLTVDGDKGDGVKTLEAQLAINTIPGDADILNVGVVGDPEDQPAPPTP